MGEEERYMIVSDGAGCFEIYDIFGGRHIQSTMPPNRRKKWDTEDGAKAWIAIHGENYAKTHGQQSHSTLRHPMATTGGPHLDKRQQVVLDALAGKVKCSNCLKEYHGSAHQKVGPVTYPPPPTHSLTVTRYIGFESPKLTVDLSCNNCDHTGLYEFPGNPLIDAGVCEEIPF